MNKRERAKFKKLQQEVEELRTWIQDIHDDVNTIDNSINELEGDKPKKSPADTYAEYRKALHDLQNKKQHHDYVSTSPYGFIYITSTTYYL